MHDSGSSVDVDDVVYVVTDVVSVVAGGGGAWYLKVLTLT